MHARVFRDVQRRGVGMAIDGERHRVIAGQHERTLRARAAAASTATTAAEAGATAGIRCAVAWLRLRRRPSAATAAVPTAAVPGHVDPGSSNVANTSASCGAVQDTTVAVCPFGLMHSPVLSEKIADFL